MEYNIRCPICDKRLTSNKTMQINLSQNEKGKPQKIITPVFLCANCSIYFITVDDFSEGILEKTIDNKPLFNIPGALSELYKRINTNNVKKRFTGSHEQISVMNKYSDYKIDFRRALIACCLKNDKKIGGLLKVLNRHNVSLTKINNTKINKSLNSDLVDYFKVSDINDLMIDECEIAKNIGDWIRQKAYLPYVFNTNKIEKSLYENKIFVGVSGTIDDGLIMSASIPYSVEDIKNNQEKIEYIRIDIESKSGYILKDYRISKENYNEIYDLYIKVFHCHVSESLRYIKENKVLFAYKILKAMLESGKGIGKICQLKDGTGFELEYENGTYTYRFDREKSEIEARYNYGINYFVMDKGNEIFSLYKKYINSIKQNKKGEVIEGSTRILKVADFLVRGNDYNCTNTGHKLYRITAVVRVRNKNGISEVELPASFCAKCNRYYILNRHYNLLKQYGYICCRVDEYESLRKGLSNSFSNYQEKSILRTYGYNVNQQEDLSSDERHSILDFVIENKIMSKYEVINFLEWQINQRKNSRNNYELAIEKWSLDADYVRKKQKSIATVLVDSISVTKNKYVIKDKW